MQPETIYEAALDVDARDHLPRMLAQACGGRSAVLSWRHEDESRDVLGYSNLAPEMMAEYADIFWTYDIWSTMAMRPLFENKIVSDEDIVPFSQFKSSIFYNDFIRRHGENITHVLGGSQTSAFGNGLFGIYRFRHDEPFDGHDKAQLADIMRHVRSALVLRGRLSAAQQSDGLQRAAWDAVSLAAILVRSDGRIAQHNAAADAVFRRADCIVSSANRLQTVSAGDLSRLMRAVKLATDPHQTAGSSLCLETLAEVEYLISISPLRRQSGPSLALVLFKDPLDPADKLKTQTRDAWGLTEYEAAVAAELAHGHTIAEIAVRRSVRESTVKTQLKAISAKMDAKGRSEILAKMRMLP